MKTTIIAILFLILTGFTETKGQETLYFDDGGYLYAHELKSVVGSKIIKKWQQDTAILSVQNFMNALNHKGVYVMPTYNPNTVESFLVEKFPDRYFLILNDGVSYFPYMLYYSESADIHGKGSWKRTIFNNKIPKDILNRAIIAGRAN